MKQTTRFGDEHILCKALGFSLTFLLLKKQEAAFFRQPPFLSNNYSGGFHPVAIPDLNNIEPGRER